jgi:hypothetical protein
MGDLQVVEVRLLEDRLVRTKQLPPLGTKLRTVYDVTIRPGGATRAELNRATEQDAWSYKTNTEDLARRVGGTAHRDPPGRGDIRRFWITIP